LLTYFFTQDESYLEFTSKFAKSEPKASQETAGEGTKSKKKSGKSQPSKPSKSAKDQPVKSEEAVSDEKSFEKVELEETDESSGAEEDDEPSKTTNDDFIQSLLGDHLKLFNEIYTACFTNNRSKLNQTLTDFINSDQEKAEVEKRGQLVERLLNKRLNKDNGFTLLHLTSQLGHFECIRELLLNGASPALADLTRQHRLPYFLSANKQTRDQYRLFVNDFPERYDYEAAKINDPLSVEKLAERAEKDKEKKRKKNKLKKQRDAQVKQKLTLQESELNERKKFLELTDQEKKKLILDRNFLNLLPLDAKKTPAVDNSAASESIKQPESPKYSTEDFKVISRCWFCGVNNSSHVPFEYFDYKFCSMKCLKSHREQQQQQKIAQSNKK
jgi:ankyrin repeat protein